MPELQEEVCNCTGYCTAAEWGSQEVAISATTKVLRTINKTHTMVPADRAGGPSCLHKTAQNPIGTDKDTSMATVSRHCGSSSWSIPENNHDC